MAHQAGVESMSAIPPEYLNQIVTGDARELARGIPDESIDLIFTDPVYQNIDDYRWLAETAARVLKPSGAILTFCGIGFLPDTLDALRAGGLIYRWQLLLLQMFRSGSHSPNGFSHFTECLWLDRFGNSRPHKQVPDVRSWQPVMDGFAVLYDSRVMRWFNDPNFVAYYLDAFSCGDDTVADFFTGSGTVPAVRKMLGRHYIAFEIDPDTAERARQRVAMTQPPLLVPQPEQAEMVFA